VIKWHLPIANDTFENAFSRRPTTACATLDER